MDFSEFTAGENDNNRRLDKVIRNFIPELPLTEIYKLLRKGLIKVNSKKSDQAYKVCTGDIIKIPDFALNKSKESNQSADDLPPLPEIVFENQHILILNKPYDMLVHGDKTSLDEIVKAYYKNTKQDCSLSFKPGPLHRIDRKTTGLIAFSMSLEGAQWFSENIKNHTIQKKYYGIIEGHLDKKEIWEDFITRNEEENESFHKVTASKKEEENSKSAHTEVIPVINSIYKNNPVALVEFDIKTGRTHQIRSQSQLHNHSLLGDTAYGGKKISGLKQDHYLQSHEFIFPKNNPIGLPEKVTINVNPLFKEIIKEIEI